MSASPTFSELAAAAHRYRRAQILNGAGYSGADHLVNQAEVELDAALAGVGLSIDVSEICTEHEATIASGG